MHVSAAGVVLFASVIGYLAFLLWYGGRGRAMDASEADSLLEQVRSHAEMAAAPVAPGPLESRTSPATTKAMSSSWST